MIKALLLTAFLAQSALAQDLSTLRTAPERTDFQETTRYADVVSFVERVAAASPLIHLTTMGYTIEGRALPMAVVGRVSDASPEAVRASGKTVVYLQGNIHAGEVEGKEVLMVLLREIAQGQHAALLDSLVLLVTPIFNADGNERVLLTNRGPQHGPVAGMGTRPNAQDLNINRDHTKLDSPEARSFVRMLNLYDPQLAADLHTTNGTQHAYHLTYSPPLHPNTHPDIIALTRGRLFPAMTRAVKANLGWDFYYYGNVSGQGENRAWATFDHRPRFNNNYLGLRNRIGVLSEAYSYATFEDRIIATKAFVLETLRFAHANATEIRRLVAAADAASLVGQSLALRAATERSATRVEILMGGTVEERNPFSGATMLRRTDERRPEMMWEMGTFAATESGRAPRTYYVPAALRPVLENLTDHGVRMQTLTAARTVQGERFRIDAQTVSPTLFESRNERTLTGAWEAASLTLPAGTVEVSMEQPLARLIFMLLEPRSDDGLLNWGTFGAALDGATHYPVVRVP